LQGICHNADYARIIVTKQCVVLQNLLSERQWLSSAALEGPWKVTAKLPTAMSNLRDQPNWADVKKAIPPVSGAATAPKVFYSNVPDRREG
jgi:hypothetical protein